MSKKLIHPWLDAEKHLSRQDIIMKNLIKEYGPCRLTPSSDYFCTLCDSIISQQLSTKVADAIYTRFAAYFDGKPTPEAVAKCDKECLRSVGLSGQKAVYMLDLAQKFLNSQVTPDQFGMMTDQEIINQLTAVKGIGVWTAQIFLLFALNRPDVFPVDDLGIKKAIQNLHNLPSLPDKRTMLTIAEPWRPFTSVASWYLWQSLNNK